MGPSTARWDTLGQHAGEQVVASRGATLQETTTMSGGPSAGSVARRTSCL